MVMGAIADVEDMNSTFRSLTFFLVFHIVGQMTHFTLMCMTYAAFCRNPFSILRHCGPPWFISIAAANS